MCSFVIYIIYIYIYMLYSGVKVSGNAWERPPFLHSGDPGLKECFFPWERTFPGLEDSSSWRRSIVVRTLVSAGELSLSCAGLLAGWLTVKPSANGQPTWPTQPSIPQGSVNE